MVVGDPAMIARALLLSTFQCGRPNIGHDDLAEPMQDKKRIRRDIWPPTIACMCSAILAAPYIPI